MKTILVVLVFCLLGGCATGETRISREEAIERVRQLARMNRPEIEATNVPLINVRAELVTFGDAAKRVWKAERVPSGQDPEQQVWLVTMDGEWHNGMTAPGVPLTQTPYTRLAVIVDATTGDTLGSSYRP